MTDQPRPLVSTAQVADVVRVATGDPSIASPLPRWSPRQRRPGRGPAGGICTTYIAARGVPRRRCSHRPTCCGPLRRRADACPHLRPWPSRRHPRRAAARFTGDVYVETVHTPTEWAGRDRPSPRWADVRTTQPPIRPAPSPRPCAVEGRQSAPGTSRPDPGSSRTPPADRGACGRTPRRRWHRATDRPDNRWRRCCPRRDQLPGVGNDDSPRSSGRRRCRPPTVPPGAPSPGSAPARSPPSTRPSRTPRIGTFGHRTVPPWPPVRNRPESSPGSPRPPGLPLKDRGGLTSPLW